MGRNVSVEDSAIALRYTTTHLGLLTIALTASNIRISYESINPAGNCNLIIYILWKGQC